VSQPRSSQGWTQGSLLTNQPGQARKAGHQGQCLRVRRVPGQVWLRAVGLTPRSWMTQPSRSTRTSPASRRSALHSRAAASAQHADRLIESGPSRESSPLPRQSDRVRSGRRCPQLRSACSDRLRTYQCSRQAWSHRRVPGAAGCIAAIQTLIELSRQRTEP
jgi:hypothetical protein